jgi:ribonuclease HI
MLAPLLKSPRAVNQRLLVRWKKHLDGMPPQTRKLFWSAYRWLRKNFWSSLSHPKQFSLVYHQRYAELHPAAQLLALKLAQYITWHTLAAQGPGQRWARHLGQEFFHLARLHLKAHHKDMAFDEGLAWHKGSHSRRRLWRAVSDGSIRPGHAGVGVVVYDDANDIRAELSISLNPAEIRSPVVCELKAAEMALQTLWALGARDALLQTDSAAVVHALQGRLTARHQALTQALLQQTERFDTLSVARAPRTTTWLADSLASRGAHTLIEPPSTAESN